MRKFKTIYKFAAQNKGGEEILQSLLTTPLSRDQIEKIGNDRFLSAMTKVVNQAGFSWRVIENKWPTFEEAFFNFNIARLTFLDFDEWQNYTKDRRVVRNWQNIKATMKNLDFINLIIDEYGSFGKFLASWPENDQIGLMQYLKKNGSRLGGNSGQYFLRNVGYDAFILSRDVCTALRGCGLDISIQPKTKRELKLAQEAFNKLKKESKLPYCQISQILAYSISSR